MVIEHAIKFTLASVLTSFADIAEWLIAVIVIPSSPVIPLVHYTALFVFSVIVLTFFPVLISRNRKGASVVLVMTKASNACRKTCQLQPKIEEKFLMSADTTFVRRTW